MYCRFLSKEVWKLKFRQYGKVKSTARNKQGQEETRTVEKVRREKIKDGESQKKEGAGAQRKKKVAKNGVIPLIFGSGGSKIRLANATSVERFGQMRNEKLHAIVAPRKF